VQDGSRARWGGSGGAQIGFRAVGWPGGFRVLRVGLGQGGCRSHGRAGRARGGCWRWGAVAGAQGSHVAVLGAQDFLGQAFVALGEVIGSQRGRLERALT